MKFCKNLQRVVDISDPEWAPYWTNYKMLKKLIKELPSLVPADDGNQQRVRVVSQKEKNRCDSPESVGTISSGKGIGGEQEEGKRPPACVSSAELEATTADPSISKTASVERTNVDREKKIGKSTEQVPTNDANVIGKSPGEVAFFKLLHTEFKKATHFFDRAQQEFIIREERVREGFEITKKPNSIMVNEKWSLLAKSLYRLYKDLLLLETFAIMTYCSFSKILKKHDKVTGYNTRCAFMENVVNKANFTTYPKVLEMIGRCEKLYEEVSGHLRQEGKQGLYEDERLFINMINRLNEQCLESPDVSHMQERQKERSSRSGFHVGVPRSPKDSCRPESKEVSSIRSLVEENEQKIRATVSETLESGSIENRMKRKNTDSSTYTLAGEEKRPRTTL